MGAPFSVKECAMGGYEDGPKVEEVAGVSVINFQMGLIEEDDAGNYFLAQETEYIPYNPGQLFGYAFTYINHTAKTVDLRTDWLLPDRPISVRME